MVIPHGDGRPAGRCRFDRVCAAEHVHAFCEPFQTEAAAVGNSGIRCVRDKAVAVITDGDFNIVLVTVHGDVSLARAGMSDHVGQALLKDTVRC